MPYGTRPGGRVSTMAPMPMYAKKPKDISNRTTQETYDARRNYEKDVLKYEYYGGREVD